MTAEKGFELPSLTVTLRREDLVRYAGASGDLTRSTTATGWPPRSACPAWSRTAC
jgi:hypothetical protein